MAQPTQDHSIRTKMGTYVDCGDQPLRPGNSAIRYAYAAAPQTRQFPPDEEYEDAFITVTQYDDVTQGNTEGDVVINQDYYQQRRNRQPRLHHTATDPQLTIKTAPSKLLRVDVAKPFSFYIKSFLVIGAGALVTGALVWNLAVVPVVQHWHTGDGYPSSLLQVKIDNKQYEFLTWYLPPQENYPGRIIVDMVPDDPKQKSISFDVVVADDNGNKKTVTLKAEKDETGHLYLQTYINNIPGPKLLDDGHHSFKVE